MTNEGEKPIKGLVYLDNEPVNCYIESTLLGDLITLENEHNKIIAIVNESNWFFKVKLLKAKGLNYKWAREIVLKLYREIKQ